MAVAASVAPSTETLAETAVTTPPKRLSERKDDAALAERTEAHDALRSAEPADTTEPSSGNVTLDAVADRSGGGTTAGPTATLGRCGNTITAVPLAAQPEDGTGAAASAEAAAPADSVVVTAGAVVVAGVLAVVVDVVSDEGGAVTVVSVEGAGAGDAGAVVAVVCGAGGGRSSDTATSGKASARNVTATPSPPSRPQRDLGIGHRYHAQRGTAPRRPEKCRRPVPTVRDVSATGSQPCHPAGPRAPCEHRALHAVQIEGTRVLPGIH